MLVDGKEPGPQDLEKIVEIREDGAFYMGDYIAAVSYTHLTMSTKLDRTSLSGTGMYSH